MALMVLATQYAVKSTSDSGKRFRFKRELVELIVLGCPN